MTSVAPRRQPPPPAGEPLDAWPADENQGVVGAIVDIDGTLVDTSYHHTIAWGRAFADHGVDVPLWQVHRHNGMGGDQLVAAVAGDAVEARLGDRIRESEARRYGELIGEVKSLPGARDLLAGLRRRGHRVVLASSAKLEEVEHYVDLLGARELVDAWTSSADVVRPEPAREQADRGFGADELRGAGCCAIYTDAAELAGSLDEALAAAAAPAPLDNLI